MDPLPYNITLSSQTATISYFPSREGSIEAGWNSSYSSGAKEVGINTLQGIGAAYHRTTHPGAAFEFEWVGTAVYLYGKASSGSYRLSVDGEIVEIPSDDVPLRTLLGFKADLKYGSHAVKLTALGKEEVLFQYAEVTIGVGYNVTLFATVGEASAQPNPLFRFEGSTSSKSWRAEPDIHPVYHVNGSSSQIPRQMVTYEFDNTLTFTVSQASAFFLWGTVNYDHSNKRASITWSEGQKDTLLNDLSNYLDFQQIIYWEGGLDWDKTYTVQIFNELDAHSRFNSFNLTADVPWPGFSFHTLELIDGGPTPSLSTSADGPTSSPSTIAGEPTSAGQYTRTFTAGAIAGTVVGSVAIALFLAAAACLLRRWRRIRRCAKNLLFTTFNGGSNLEHTQTEQRDSIWHNSHAVPTKPLAGQGDQN
ncbi:hypothetical protein AAF712_009479 [Marasmius tenuissimus]|uniref:PA14 domain-containing protein n=1 Tax=Marasmius tenuissimus TaxID=585030 RepID=A0ABR2ZQU1_9AGAR